MVMGNKIRVVLWTYGELLDYLQCGHLRDSNVNFKLTVLDGNGCRTEYLGLHILDMEMVVIAFDRDVLIECVVDGMTMGAIIIGSDLIYVGIAGRDSNLSAKARYLTEGNTITNPRTIEAVHLSNGQGDDVARSYYDMTRRMWENVRKDSQGPAFLIVDAIAATTVPVEVGDTDVTFKAVEQTGELVERLSLKYSKGTSDFPEPINTLVC